MYVLLWERNLDVILVQRVVDGGEYLASDNTAHQWLCPYEELEVDAAVAQLIDAGDNVFRGVSAIQMEVGDSRLYQFFDLCEIGTIGYTEGDNL